MSQNLSQNTSTLFYIDGKGTQPAGHIYDDTYQNYQRKKKFAKNNKYAYFNAVLQMKRKLSDHKEVYNNVFDPEQIQKNQEQFANKTFYLNSLKPSPPSEELAVSKVRSNSYKIYKNPTPSGLSLPRNGTTSIISRSKLPNRNQSNLSYHEKGEHKFSLEFIKKGSNSDSRSFVELGEFQNGTLSTNRPVNPKPRLEEIMAEYRKMNRAHSKFREPKSSLSKDIVEKLNMTTRMFNPRKKRFG